ncbi:ErfK/YbiS/YcfS/YnhG family protein [Rhizobium sp. PDO1-076]|uniref:L,D-transpeptidase family protein n=1 Tax=Rhizobium sp. PDO1-076 TaxID=1125979 RepID=UPI00024E306C|nr:L,D-transpeptidase family protein [Rhizobium sp. PDO1-076]EHS52894.1 ErfK/YbiS/YcfS/YnhG family protein [Rhizobium sp. PDO1-076]
MFQRFALAFGLCLAASTALVSPSHANGSGPLQIYVSKTDQTLTVYDGDQIVATSKVSTGKAGHTTPSGVFSILEKRKYHESNLYSNAPMPFMQRLTWSGIALHEGKVPNYPASHGCVRLPTGFAKSLFSMTERGAHVIITDEPVMPRTLSHSTLFVPRIPVADGQLLSDAQLRPTTIDALLKPVEVAMNQLPPKAGASASLVLEDEEPALRILITRRSEREQILDVQHLLADLGFDVGIADGLLGSKTIAAIKGYKRWKSIEKSDAILSKSFLAALYKSAGKGPPPAGQIMIRQHFKPLFEAPISIESPELALGTHFIEAISVDRYKGKAEWRSVTLENHLTKPAMKRLGIVSPADDQAVFSAEAALTRIDIPGDIRAKIETMLSEGTSITISDIGLGTETGDGTDFITVTRPAPRS